MFVAIEEKSIDVNFYDMKELGKILKVAFDDPEIQGWLNDPVKSGMAGTPEFTYIYLLDRWFVMSFSSKYSHLKTLNEKHVFILNTRPDGSSKHEALSNLDIKNHRDSLLAIIEYEFGRDNPMDPNGSQYASLKGAFLQRIPVIESEYKKKRNIAEFPA